MRHSPERVPFGCEAGLTSPSPLPSLRRTLLCTPHPSPWTYVSLSHSHPMLPPLFLLRIFGPLQSILASQAVPSLARIAITLASLFLRCLFANFMHPTVCGYARIEFLRLLRGTRFVLVQRDDSRESLEPRVTFSPFQPCFHLRMNSDGSVVFY